MVESSCRQSNMPPMRMSWRRKFAMFRGMSSAGWVPTLSAKFSLWMPNASNPIGSKTSKPRSR